ncbi:hypothetical protein V3H18_09200, partial [Methylocystis sp. 9N]
ERLRPRRPRPVSDDPGADDAPDYPPPRVRRLPLGLFLPPAIHGGGLFPPRFPGSWGGRYPQGPRGGAGGYGAPMRGGFNRF